MTASGDLRVLFCAPAGPRRGFGHLMRCLALARAMGVRPLIALRGTRRTADAALALGAELLAPPSPSAISAIQPDVVIVDDPVASQGRRWVEAARRAGARVTTVHDLGLGWSQSDLAIDGSIARAVRAPRARTLSGTRFAVLDPALAGHAASRQELGRTRQPHRRTVLIALGGGPRRHMALAIAQSIAALVPDVQIRIAGGFVVPPDVPTGDTRIRWIAPRHGLARELARADIAVVGGGVSLYEACAIGVPSVGVPVVRSQVPTVMAFARHGAAIAVPLHAGPRLAAARVVGLLRDDARQRALSRRSRRLVDGRGAARVAAAVTALARGAAA